MAAAPIKVGVLGGTGRTGESIVNGLVESDTKYEVTVLTRPSSIASDEAKAFQARGLRIVALDLSAGTKADFLQALQGLDVVISAVNYKVLADQVRLLEAVKETASIKRFVPCFWAAPAPRGQLYLNDTKYKVLDAFQSAKVPYTVIDIGWWTQQVVPKVPSGRSDHAFFELMPYTPGDGNVPNALSDVRDIGKWVAKIIADPRTLNKFVLAYSEVFTYNQTYDLMDEVSGEKSIRQYLSAEDILPTLAEAKEKYNKDPSDFTAFFTMVANQYFDTLGLRGYNTPQYAKYLGYLDVQDLYPGEVATKPLRTLFEEVLEGKPSGLKVVPL